MPNKKVLIPLMNGFEETEYIAVRDVLIREGIDVDSVSLTGVKLLNANHNTRIQADMVYGIQNISLKDYDGIYIPGGGIGVANLDKSVDFDTIINAFYADNKYIGALCAAPSLLAKRGMLKGKKATCYPDEKFYSELENNGCEYISDKPYVTDQNITTGKAFDCSLIFGYELANKINDWKA